MTEPAPTEPASNQSAGKPPGPPPKWKFAVIVLLGLYPLLIIIIPLVGRAVYDLPFTITTQFMVRTLITVLIAVPLMVWVAIPMLSRVFRSWLQA
jgi:hypothetical protein